MVGMSPSVPVRRSVVVVDDDDLSRTGIEVVLARDPRLEVRGALTHDEALTNQATGGGFWFDVDVVIVDAADERRQDDHFAGVGVVELVRSHRSAAQTTVIVITGHYFNDAVRKRMREARADLFFHRTEVQNAAFLCDVVANPSILSRPVPNPQDPEAMFRHGIGYATKVNDAVSFAREQGWLTGELHESGRRPRSFDRLRSAFARTANVHVVNTDGTTPDRDQQAPSRPQIARLLDWATRAKR
jgi:CheY-like chemotaxis protein